MPNKIMGSMLILLCLVPACGRERRHPAADLSELADRVKAEFLHAWGGYRRYAWGHDELKPLSRSYRNWHSESLLLTPVDAFSSLKIMGLEQEAEDAKQLIFDRLSFAKSLDVQLFEVNIRLLGGLLSAYQLDGDRRFLELAIDLADRLLPAFQSPTGMPYRYVHLTTGATRDAHNNPAEIGTLLLEWGTLSRTTGNPLYYEKAKSAIQALYEKRSQIDLVGTVIDVETGKWIQTESHLSGRIDSYYEYLLKGWLMFGDRDLETMWTRSLGAVHTYLADDNATGLWYGRADMETGSRTRTWFGALDAFFPGVLALSGDLQRARRLQESAFRMWQKFGIEPEMLDYSTMEAVRDSYVLRPESIESAYYLYKLTQDPRYLDMGKIYLDSLVKFCRNDVAYSHLKSVETMEQEDAMQSFFLAETLKYLYLIFAPRDTVDLSQTIFNTEAHPLKRWTGEEARPTWNTNR